MQRESNEQPTQIEFMTLIILSAWYPCLVHFPGVSWNDLKRGVKEAQKGLQIGLNGSDKKETSLNPCIC